MDYNELLFAYKVRHEALTDLAQRFPNGLRKDQFQEELKQVVREIVGHTQSIAADIAILVRD
ncbi:hypothetical protein IP91_00109 [Pseudoduganella lurida]|uniref:Uncharacterized protein n=1 Tax=Pseudoduganella lurida TaxID=1036180 RepID=A0A562RKB6_9BURK|nr:hypothetical protein [Pseudoduganella lurida]TWI69044.1 hypothetical protein IP91_00109 [Pseudoduganella lurida]